MVFIKHAILETDAPYSFPHVHLCSEQVHAVSSKEKAEEKEQANKMRIALEVQMDQLRDAHQKQVAALRDEIMEKQASINELKE
jgi:kinesin family protein 5